MAGGSLQGQLQPRSISAHKMYGPKGVLDAFQKLDAVGASIELPML